MKFDAKTGNFIRASQGITNPDNDYFRHITQLYGENYITCLRFDGKPAYLNYAHAEMFMKRDFNNIFRDLSKSIEAAKQKVKDGKTE